jgi:hypothetical protein
MIRWVAYFAMVVLGTSRASVPSLTPIEKLAPPAHLDGAVFTDGDEIVALSSETSNPSKGERRCFLSAWNIQQKKWTLTKPINALPPSVSCGGLAYSSFLHRLIIIRHSELLLVTPQTLELERKISVEGADIAAVWEEDDMVYALSEPGYKPVALASYQLATGALVQKKVLPSLDYKLGTSIQVAVISNERLAVLQSEAKPLGVSERNSTLAICNQRDGLPCKSVTLPMPVANFLVFGESLLFVSDDFPDHSSRSRNQCIAKLSLATLEIDPLEYCRPDAGVHYSMSTLGNDFVVGYSGYGARRGWLDEGLVVGKSSSISVWDAKSARLVAIAPIPYGKSFTLSASVVRADTSGRKRFLFYNPTEGDEILLYDLSSLG